MVSSSCVPVASAIGNRHLAAWRPGGLAAWRGVDGVDKYVEANEQKNARNGECSICIWGSGEANTPNPDVMCNSRIKFGMFYETEIQEKQQFHPYEFKIYCTYKTVINDY
jgi:hypothetical protein